VLVDRAQGHELAGGAGGHLRAVVAHRQQDRPGRVVYACVGQAVLAGGDARQQALAFQRLGEHDLDLGGGLLRGDDLGGATCATPGPQVTVAATPARVKWVVSNIQIELGVYSTQSGNGLRTLRPGRGSGRSRRPSAASTRRTDDGDTHTRSR
jgi:hypothetical protein